MESVLYTPVVGVQWFLRGLRSMERLTLYRISTVRLVLGLCHIKISIVSCCSMTQFFSFILYCIVHWVL